jgi:hypothetical protein
MGALGKISTTPKAPGPYLAQNPSSKTKKCEEKTQNTIPCAEKEEEVAY